MQTKTEKFIHKLSVELQALHVRISLHAFSSLFMQRVKGFEEQIKAKVASTPHQRIINPDLRIVSHWAWRVSHVFGCSAVRL